MAETKLHFARNAAIILGFALLGLLAGGFVQGYAYAAILGVLLASAVTLIAGIRSARFGVLSAVLFALAAIGIALFFLLLPGLISAATWAGEWVFAGFGSELGRQGFAWMTTLGILAALAFAAVAVLGLRRAAVGALGLEPEWKRLSTNRNWLATWFMLPAMAFLILFLAYPLGLGVSLSFTDAKIGRPGEFIGLENYEWLSDDTIFWLSVFNTVLYTTVASVMKFGLGLYLALLLNERLPFKAMVRAIVLIPFIVPTVLSAIAFWWIYDPQFSIVSWSLKRLGLIQANVDFLGDPWNARWSTIFANIWRGIPFVAITLLAGLQTVAPSLYEAATLDGASAWQRFRYITYPLLTPIIAVVMTFSVIFTFTDFQLIWSLTRGGPVNATHLMATLSYQRAIIGGQLGEGAAISTAMIPFLLGAIIISWFGLQRRKWQQGEN